MGKAQSAIMKTLCGKKSKSEESKEQTDLDESETTDLEPGRYRTLKDNNAAAGTPKMGSDSRDVRPPDPGADSQQNHITPQLARHQPYPKHQLNYRVRFEKTPHSKNSEAEGGGTVATSQHHRRDSQCHRTDSEVDMSVKSISRNSSYASELHAEGFIVTPFAQILHTLRGIRSNYIALTNSMFGGSGIIGNAAAQNADKITNVTQTTNGASQTGFNKLTEEQYKKLATETLEELEWCLEQLETIQTHKSVSDMASTKFKRILNKELSHFAESGRSSNQISEYICNTFLEKQPEVILSDEKGSGICGSSSHTSKRLNIRAAMSQITGVRKLKHTNSVSASLPKYGIEAMDEQLLDETMANLDSWGVDMFKIFESSGGKPLTAVTYTVLRDRGLFKTFKIPHGTAVNYFIHVEEHYRNVPYHNSLHAADVTQSVHVLLNLPALENIFTDLEVLATIFASAIHDVDHPGLTNNYLVATGSELALMYNDESVLENHHLAVAFKLLQQNDCDILVNLPAKSRQLLRRMIIDIVLATDMNKHLDHIANLKTTVETCKISGEGICSLESYNQRIQILENLMHCADLSNPAKPLELYRKWTDRIMEEFFLQGDLEREQKLEISPMCDRHTATIEKSQVGFIDYIVHPLWETWADLVYPDCQDILNNLIENRDWYNRMIPDSPRENGKDDLATIDVSQMDRSRPKFQFDVSSTDDANSTSSDPAPVKFTICDLT